MKLGLKKVLTSVVLGSLLVMSQAEAAIERVRKSERVLVVVSELDSAGLPELRDLYRSLEDLTLYMTEGILGGSYKEIYYLTDAEATFAEFQEKVHALADDASVKAIDVIMSLHGAPDKLLFDDGAWKTPKMEEKFHPVATAQERVKKILRKKKMRMLYNLSCFGASHRDEFISMGFDVVNGSVDVNANSAVEFAPAMSLWALGTGFKDSFNGSNNDVALALNDGPIRIAGQLANNSLKTTNSKKLFTAKSTGSVNLKIDEIKY